MALDLKVAAIPIYFGGMGVEAVALKRRAERTGAAAPTDYEWSDTFASLTMGTASLLAPIVMPKLLGPVTSKGRYAKALVGTALGAAIATTAADMWVRYNDEEKPTAEVALAPDSGRWRRRANRLARRLSSVGAVTAFAGAITAASATWTAQTAATKLFPKRITRDLGGGAVALGVAMVAWDFMYYWNHRLQHESRFLWAIHVVHHSSERYNLSTALRQPVADSFGLFVPYGVFSLFGLRPGVLRNANSLNLIYQFWVHTDAVGKLGPAEEFLSTPSHHRVHHGSNREYLDRNHGGILIIWDRLFGTFQREEAPVIYGLTKNIDTFNPLRIASNEHAEMLGDIARSNNWRDRLSFVFRGPGWAYRRHAEQTGEPPPRPADVATAG